MDQDDRTPLPPVPAGKSNAYKPLKRLSPRHMMIIESHLAGRRNTEIAKEFGTSTSRISIILHNPTVQTYLQAMREAADQELKNLLPAAVEVLHRALEDGDLNVALRASDMILKTLGKYREPTRVEETAEDVIARVLALVRASGTVREVTEPQNRLIDVTPRELGFRDRDNE